nr:ATP-binding protein [uncultured Holophaga sp.]
MTTTLRHKLSRLTLVTVGLSLLLTLVVGCSFGVWVTLKWQNRLLDLTAQAVSSQSTPALTFQDAAAAEQSLQSAFHDTDIRAAYLYTDGGELLAEASHPGAQTVVAPQHPGPAGIQRSGLDFRLVHPIRLGDGQLGTLVLVGRMSEFLRLVWIYTAFFLMAYAVVLILIWLLTRRLRRDIEEPITALATAARNITWGNDYSVRVPIQRNDELGVLVSDFNAMLQEIEGQDLALRRYQNHLQDLVDDRSAQIQRESAAKKSLERQLMRAQRLESLGTLAGGVAHDLNNVLSPILLSVETLKDLYPDPRGQKLLALLEAAARRGSAIVKQILTFARGSEGDFVPLDLRHPLKETLGIIQQTFPRGIEIRSEFPDTHCSLMGDATQLHQLFLNLCVNARDAMPEGGTLALSIRRRLLDEPYARVHLDARPGIYFQVAIEDTGEGMSAETLDRIFEPFFTTKGVGRGTGLGLSTVHAIAKAHGGFLTCYSEPGKGTAFNVFLPALDEEMPRTEPLKASDALPHGHGELILVVDDETFIREVTCQTLETYGYQTLTAMDGVEAVKLFRDRHDEIAVVLTDMMMPNLDGHAAIKAIREIQPGARIIAASGIHSHNRQDLPPAERPDAFLPKPFAADTLLWALHRILPRRQD